MSKLSDSVNELREWASDAQDVLDNDDSGNDEIRAVLVDVIEAVQALLDAWSQRMRGDADLEG